AVCVTGVYPFFFFSSRRRHTRSKRDWSSDVCSSDLGSTCVRVQVPRDRPQVEPGPADEDRHAPLVSREIGEHCANVPGEVCDRKIGRASCRERVWGTVVGGSAKKNKARGGQPEEESG